MRRRNKPRGLKALAALLSAAAIILLAVRQRSTTPPPRALVKSESKASEALRAVRAADARTRDAEARAAYADHVAQEAKGDAERREELNQALRARAQAAEAAASAAEAREQASNARAAAAERRAAQAEAALKAREQASNARAAAAERRAAQAEAALGAAKPVAAAGAAEAREQASNARAAAAERRAAQIRFTCDIQKEVAKYRNLQNLKLLFDGRRVGNSTLGPLMRKTGSSTMDRFAGPSANRVRRAADYLHTNIVASVRDPIERFASGYRQVETFYELGWIPKHFFKGECVLRWTRDDCAGNPRMKSGYVLAKRKVPAAAAARRRTRQIRRLHVVEARRSRSGAPARHRSIDCSAGLSWTGAESV
ncbi:unnamed protein product [Pelagomonas calceolata]|uniref:Sulfotransferase domain-containing protein n=1 Tax=Pelagomonas calceolata TaxID=35677 RepID=A0A8J2WVI3_9STRA|nr:unnamed protein product [Pelagomonas calceolata]